MSDSKLTLNPPVVPDTPTPPVPAPAPTPTPAPVADAATGITAATPTTLEAELNQAVSQLTEKPKLSFPTPPAAPLPGNDFSSLEQPLNTPADTSINSADLAQTQVGTDPFGGQVSSQTMQQLQETPAVASGSGKPKPSSFLKSKAVIAALAVVVFGGGAFATVNIISSNGTNSIAPNAPASKPKAADAVPTKKPSPKPVCGNGVVEPPEACDDTNIRNGDGCTSSCKKEVVATPTPAITPAPTASASADPLEGENVDDLGNLDDLEI